MKEEKQNKTVILVITNRSQVSKWWYGDLKIPVSFFLTQALFYNGDQKQKLSSLYCLGLVYYIWVISGRNVNCSKSKRLVLQNKQTSHPQIKTQLYCQKCSLKGLLDNTWFHYYAENPRQISPSSHPRSPKLLVSIPANWIPK